MDWKDINANNNICHCKQVTKKEIIMAISNGTRSLEAIKETTGACTGDRCHVMNPTGRSCREDIEAMIEYYGPLAEAFKKD